MKKSNATRSSASTVRACLLLFLASGISQAQLLPAFPGAEGFGAFARGGRGGRVYEVTHLGDSGPGSLRDAVEAEGPRIVVFRVSGTIALESNLTIRNPYITVAGQTAPGDGVCLRDASLGISADHVVIRFLRCRLGDRGRGGDAIGIGSGRHIILDHCSASWSLDEVLSSSTSLPGLSDITVQWCFITEALNPENHGFGSLIRGCHGARYSYHHNLYAHNRGRNPRPGNYDDPNPHDQDPDGLLLDFRNNVIYNWGGDAAGYNSDGSNGVDSITRMNFVGNYYQSGADSDGTLAFSERTPSAQAYFAGNAMNRIIPDDPWSLVSFHGFSDEALAAYQQATPIDVAPVITDDALTAYERVLAEAGATLPARDSVDERIVNGVRYGTGRIINDEDDVRGWPPLASGRIPRDADRDGMPDQWERRHGLSSSDPDDRNADHDQDGYTNLEEYLNGTLP